jgi:hypothetical protein
MSRLGAVKLKVIVQKDGAAYRGYGNGTFPEPEFIDDFRNELVDKTMGAARAIMCWPVT